jgi:hypothetical protein
MTRIFAGTVVSPEIAQPFHRTIWPERSGTISRKPLQHSHFDAVPCGTLNPSRQYLKLSLRGRSVPPRLLGVESGTMRADLRPCKPRGCGSVEGSQARGERGRNEVSRAHETDRETFRAGWLAGPGVTLDSSEASTRCLTALPRSDESTGFPEARRLHPPSHGIPKVALAPLPERIIESYQAGHGSRRAVRQTAGLVGHSHACVGPGRERVRLGGAGPPTIPGNRQRGRVEGKLGSAIACSKVPRTIPEAHRLYNFSPISARRIEFYCENIPEKPSAVPILLEINRGRYLGMLLDFRMLENDKPL